MSVLSRLQATALTRLTKAAIAVEVIEARHVEGWKAEYRGVQVQRKGGQTTIAAQLTTDNPEQLFQWLGTHAGPVVLLLRGDKVLHKETQDQPEAHEKTVLLTRLMPGAAPSDFLLSSASVPGIRHVFITRASYAEEVLSRLSAVGLRIVAIQLGLAPLLQLAPLLLQPASQGPSSFTFPSHRLQFEHGQLTGVENDATTPADMVATPPLRFGASTIPMPLAPILATALAFLHHPTPGAAADLEAVHNQYENFRFLTIAKPVLIAGLSLAFGLLLVSTVWFSSYREKVLLLEAAYEDRLAAWSHLQEQAQQRQRTAQLLQVAGLRDQSRLSFFADQVTEDLPQFIYLRKLTIHPAATALWGGAEFDDHLMLIEGNCFSDEELTEWAESLRRKAWVQSVRIQQYTEGPEDQLGAFSLVVQKQAP